MRNKSHGLTRVPAQSGTKLAPKPRTAKARVQEARDQGPKNAWGPISSPSTARKSHGTGAFRPEQFAACGSGCVFERGVMVFHPENIRLGKNVYVGHQSILKGYYRNLMAIGDDTWIGQQCFFHAAGGLTIGARVGVGPAVKIITSHHREAGRQVPILWSPVAFAAVTIEDEADLGMGTIILPGVTIGKGAQIGAGSVVTRDIAPYCVAMGAPARVVRERAQ
jgi:acetyltransferase-like isoleucine patch superfamily enzyme